MRLNQLFAMLCMVSVFGCSMSVEDEGSMGSGSGDGMCEPDSFEPDGRGTWTLHTASRVDPYEKEGVAWSRDFHGTWKSFDPPEDGSIDVDRVEIRVKETFAAVEGQYFLASATTAKRSRLILICEESAVVGCEYKQYSTNDCVFDADTDQVAMEAHCQEGDAMLKYVAWAHDNAFCERTITVEIGL